MKKTQPAPKEGQIWKVRYDNRLILLLRGIDGEDGWIWFDGVNVPNNKIAYPRNGTNDYSWLTTAAKDYEYVGEVTTIMKKLHEGVYGDA